MTDRTRAVVAVDIYGYPCELDELRALCADRGIALIEDACEALGARYKGHVIGSQGPSAVFAFYPNKQMTTGEGGMVTTHSEDEWRLLRSLRNQGRADSGGWLEHARLGFNYRLDDVRAAIGIGQLEKLDEILASREAVAARYSELLGAIPGLELPCADDPDHERSWFVYVVTLPVETDREAVIARLDAHGIQTARYLPCIHLQPYMQQRFGFEAGLCPVAEELSSRTLALPFHARLGSRTIRSTWRPRSMICAAQACSVLGIPFTAGGGRDISRLDATRSPGQGEALAAWAIWGTTTLAVLVTYSRIDPADTYNVSRDGLAGGLSRALTLVNFPIALVAIALALLATAVLPRAAWWAAAPAIVLCATIPWFVDQDDLDARWVNAIPAVGVLAALGLTVAAVRRAGTSFAPRRPWDGVRLGIAVVVILLSLPWITAELGFHFPGDFFMGEELAPEKDGTLIAAVHLGHHHGLDGALLALTALLLSRVRVERSPAANRRALVPRDDARLRRASTSSRTSGTSRS